MKQLSNQQIAMRVSKISILWNIILAVSKFAAGILAGSSAMVSDGVHTASDIFSTVIVMVGVKVAGKEADKEHPYGHERLECVAAILLAVVLFATGVGIGLSGLQKILHIQEISLAIPGILALVAAVFSILVKEGMYWYTKAAAKKINSGALLADAWHHRSDALSSVGSFIGIMGARMGLPVCDPLASVVICIFILKAAVEIFMDSINKMTDVACDDETVQAMKKRISQEAGVMGVDEINTRLFGDKIYVDVEISADGDTSLHEAHGIAQRVHDCIEKSFPKVKHCMVHVNPANDYKKPLVKEGATGEEVPAKKELATGEENKND